MLRYDVAIAGSGLVASLAAHALSQAGFKVVCLAAAMPKRKVMPNHDRAIALSAASLDAFAQWGLGDLLSKSEPIRRVHVSVKGRYGSMRMDADRLQVSCLGRVVSAVHLHQSLGHILASRDVDTYTGSMASLRMDDAGVQIQFATADNHLQISAAVLLVADGAGSLLSQQLGLHTMVDDYQQYALAAHVQCTVPHARVAYERFLETGPLALLPTMDAMTVAMVWALPSAVAKVYRAAEPAVFNQHLQQAFGYRLGALSLSAPPACFPLQRKRTRPLSHSGVVLLGNAASTCHPVAGQGLNLAVRDLVRLLDVLKALAPGFAADEAVALGEAFAASSTPDHEQITQFTHGLAKLLVRDSHLSCLAGQGLCVLDGVPGFKQYISRRAMGYGAPSAVFGSGV